MRKRFTHNVVNVLLHSNRTRTSTHHEEYPYGLTELAFSQKSLRSFAFSEARPVLNKEILCKFLGTLYLDKF
ncbi:hypothetical protein O181_126021 [Austropuccinia psidii MF-1]|uniref:Uncharacterized protein n=1 Tax=Austropuccinia psidii MF-1 TaxID=1389203 RepID=A0A9Q3KTI5_9BASI|nr:hypothetical protein [Austropuccinia psidii MF-1]